MWQGLAALTAQPWIASAAPTALKAAAAIGWRMALATVLVTTSQATLAASPPSAQQFYQQLIDMTRRNGYVPTRTFELVQDENGGRLVADDDPQLQFNLLWLEQHHPDYRVREGGAALGRVARDFLKNAWRNYRNANAQLTLVPDESGAGSLMSTDIDYRLRWSDDEVTVGIEYHY